MHELALCLNIIKILEAHAAKFNYRQIKVVWLEVGELANVEISALKFNFSVATRSTLAENARLEIIVVPGKARCDSCKEEFKFLSYASRCPQCDGAMYQLIQGKELMVKKVEAE